MENNNQTNIGKKKEIVKEALNKIAKDYYTVRDMFDNSKEIERFVKLLPINGKILDVGCGGGIPATKYLVDSGFDVVGIDFSDNMLNLARKNVPNATFWKKDMTKLDFKDNSFDGIVAFYSIIHVPKELHSSLFRSFQGILKNGGVMLISMGSKEYEGTEHYYGANMFWSHYNPEKTLQFIKDSDFEIIFDEFNTCGGEKNYWILARNVK